MNYSTVIFDMDGLLIDSEPLWQEAGASLLQQYGISLSDAQYHSTTGLRTPEWIDYWFGFYKIDKQFNASASAFIEKAALEIIQEKGNPMPGVKYIMDFFKAQNFRIGLASSSPMHLIQMVIKKLEIGHYLSAVTSAEKLPFGKPHPQVFLDCATLLQVSPSTCICFEDSFNGLIAAKAARMKCVIVPAPQLHHETRWDAADLKLSSLEQFTEKSLLSL
jgi:mannitol-1-/sugar-/sorbitol-6-/2-deoxyglucose-6-phosphatase